MRSVFPNLLFSTLFLFLYWSPAEADPTGYPRSLEKDLEFLLERNERFFTGSGTWVRLSEVYLDLGNDLYEEPAKRLSAYQAGAEAAEKALNMDEDNSRAHFFYAANLGNAAQLKGLFASLTTIHKLKFHVRRALELENDFPPALHMMGMLLEKLPWVMGGNESKALGYLEKAVHIDPAYTSARLDLAKAYIERGNFPAARRELSVILNNEDSKKGTLWKTRYRPEAEKLLRGLE